MNLGMGIESGNIIYLDIKLPYFLRRSQSSLYNNIFFCIFIPDNNRVSFCVWWVRYSSGKQGLFAGGTLKYTSRQLVSPTLLSSV